MRVTVRHAGRYREIAMALGRHGFGYIAEEIGLTRLFSVPLRWILKSEPESHTLAERIRLVLEELGPTFVKLGQLASTRSDLLPESIIGELVKLQDQVTPFSAKEARAILEKEFHMPVEELLVEFDEIPLAAASIGQVHQGRLATGERVAIKIQRPGIFPIIDRDLDILRNLTAIAKKRWGWVGHYQIPQMVEEFSRSIKAELDYTGEGRNMERISKQFTGNKKIFIPKVYWECTTSKVLTMDYVEGIHLNKAPEIKASGIDVKELAATLVDAMLHQIFISGYFHADPHPGNVLVLRDGRLVFIDFGMVGRISSEMKEQLSSLIIALMRRNTEGMTRAILRMGLLDEVEDMNGLRLDLERLRETYYDIPFSQISIGTAINDLFAAAQRHGVVLPADLLLLGKSLLTVEGVLQSLDPDVSILDLAEPFGKKLLREKLDARRLGKKLLGEAVEFGESLADLPRQMQRLSSIIGKGKIKTEMDIPGMEELMRKFNQIGNRLSFSIVLLSFSIIMVGVIIGSSMTNSPILLWNIPVIDIGFVIATLMVVWLLYSIFRSGRF
ncbi:AarF/UbiB family protein [Paenibacillus sp. GM2]|uniref:AarF/UbiB family protein n=1 Tax=Paenibacillus sp. GM2 TaxID=1622070 RepID=UPI000837DE80|nr:AarF/UbiB family protein [Paenibacillus sp. GM2]